MISQKIHPHFFSRSPEHFGGKIPFIVTDLVQKLRELNAIKTVGIFRLSGSANDINTLVSLLDEGRVQDWSKYTNVNTIATTLKRYFRDKAETDPFFPPSLNERLTAASKIKDEEEQYKALKEIIEELPQARKITLAYIVDYLVEVEANQSDNKMNFNNIAIVFAPNLFKFDQNNPTLFNSIFTSILKGAKTIFGDIHIDDKLILTDDDMKVIMNPPVDTTNALELRALRKASLLSFVPGEVVSSLNSSN